MREDVVIELIEVRESCYSWSGNVSDASEVETVSCKTYGVGNDSQANKAQRLQQCQCKYHLVSHICHEDMESHGPTCHYIGAMIAVVKLGLKAG